MTARFFLFCYNLMQGSSISVTSFLRKKRLPVLARLTGGAAIITGVELA